MSPSRSLRSKQVSDLESHLGFWLRLVSNHVSGSFRKRVEEQGVSVSEWVALRRLFDAQATSASALIEALGMTKGAVSKIVTRLEEKGLAERTADEADRRAQSVALTKAGRALVPRLAALADENDRAVFGHLASPRQHELLAIMQDIAQRHRLTQVPVD